MAATDVMRRPARMGFQWQMAQWTRVVPGKIGTACVALVAAALFLPLGSFGFFSSWLEGSRVVLVLGALCLSVAIGRDTATRQPAEFWIYQKGLSLADWGMNRWVLDFGLALVVNAAWLVTWAIAARMHGETVSARSMLAMGTLVVSIHLIATSLLFVLGAAGSRRGTEYLVLLFMIALIEPVLTRALPGAVATAARVILPPVLPAVNARVQLSAGEPLTGVLMSLLHVGAYGLAMLAMGAGLLGRRRPEENG